MVLHALVVMVLGDELVNEAFTEDSLYIMSGLQRAPKPIKMTIAAGIVVRISYGLTGCS